MASNHIYEFGGPRLGPLALLIGLPLVCYFLVYSCNSEGCMTLYGGIKLPGFPSGTQLASWEAAGLVLGWVTVQVTLHLVLPGKRQHGVKLPNGESLEYKFTGFYNYILTVGAVLYLGFYSKQLNLSWVYDNFVPLLTASTALSFALAAALYTASFRKGVLKAKGGSTESGFYNFFIGRELNPRIGSFDMKHFCELYPGMIGWVVIDLCMAHKQLQELGYVTSAMMLVCAFHAVYVLDSLWLEPAILTTMDITSDGFGFMLAFGDLTWVPFTYSLQARYLVDFPQSLTSLGIAGIIMLKLTAYLIFRASNSQKNQFRRDRNHPSVRQLKTLKTERGTELIISGWWGISRHINYFGDWLLAWSWCLPCGFGNIVPYFYVIYFGMLLLHRERRDDHACRQKYGKDWDKYCAIVRSRIVPLVY